MKCVCENYFPIHGTCKKDCTWIEHGVADLFLCETELDPTLSQKRDLIKSKK